MVGSGTESWKIMRRCGDGNWKLGCGRFVIQIKPRPFSSFVGPFIKEAMNRFLRFFFHNLTTTKHVATLILMMLLLLLLWVALKLQARVITGQAKGTPLFGRRRWGTHSQWCELPWVIHRGSREAFHNTTRFCEESMLIHLLFLSINIPTPFY